MVNGAYKKDGIHRVTFNLQILNLDVKLTGVVSSQSGRVGENKRVALVLLSKDECGPSVVFGKGKYQIIVRVQATIEVQFAFQHLVDD